MSVLTGDDHVEILISETEITARVNQLAKQISESYPDTEQLVVVGLLRGSFIFIADLVRRLNLPVEVDFMTVSSYGDSTVSSRQVKILKDLETNIHNRDVLVVEDIVDTGHTLKCSSQFPDKSSEGELKAIGREHDRPHTPQQGAC